MISCCIAKCSLSIKLNVKSISKNRRENIEGTKRIIIYPCYTSKGYINMTSNIFLKYFQQYIHAKVLRIYSQKKRIYSVNFFENIRQTKIDTLDYESCDKFMK